MNGINGINDNYIDKLIQFCDNLSMNWKTYRKKLLKNPKFVEALKETELEYEIARTVIKARIDRGLSQQQLAEKLHTRQSVISRVERAQTTPSLSFLKRLADVLGGSLQVQLRI